MDCGCGSLVKLCGLRGIILYDPHTSVDDTGAQDAGVSLSPVLPATHVVVSLKGRMLSGRSTNQTTSEASDVTLVTVIQNWSCVAMSFACAGQHGGALSWIGRLFRFKWPSLEKYCRFALAYVRRWLRATVAVNSICAVSNARVRRAFVHHTVRPHVTSQPRNIASIGVQCPLPGLLSYLFVPHSLIHKRQWSRVEN